MSKDNGGPASDRELLELAAKAAGVSVVRGYFGCGECWLTEKAGFGLTPWNPLTDDGDALRLAVKLGIDVEMHGMLANFPFCCASAKNAEIQCEEEAVHIDDMASVRRAIVRAAAAIGSAM